MKKISLILSVMFLSIILIGCQEDKSTKTLQNKPQVDNPAVHAEVTENDFVYRLVSEKKTYAKNEPLKIYAELEYIGDKESITITHADSPFHFPMTEKTRNYQIDYAMQQPSLNTVMFKGEPLREEYRGSGGFGSEDEDEFKEFMRQIMKQEFPEGDYVVNGFADFYVIENDVLKQEKAYKIETQLEFNVSDNNGE